MAWRLAPSFARFMPEWPIAERRQPNNRSDQKENHDELGVFSDETNHWIHSYVTRKTPLLFVLLDVGKENIGSRAGRM
jgi:hypothetical protein